MTLQLTGAMTKDSRASLHAPPPVVVVGGGLTAVDAATEALAYYPRSAERFLSRYEEVVAMGGEAGLRGSWTRRERIEAEETMAHGRALRRAAGGGGASGSEV